MRHQVRVPQRLAAGRDQLAAERLVTGDPHPAQVGQDRRRGALGRDARLALEQVARSDLSVALVVVVAADRRCLPRRAARGWSPGPSTTGTERIVGAGAARRLRADDRPRLARRWAGGRDRRPGLRQPRGGARHPVLLRARVHARRPRLRVRRGGARRRRARRGAAGRRRCPGGPGRGRARRDGHRGRPLLRGPHGRAARSGGDGHERQDHHRLPRPRAARGGRTRSAGCSGP